MIRRAECIDGLSRTLREDRKEITPHAVPFHPRIVAMDKEKKFDGMDASAFGMALELEEPNMREQLLLSALEPYAPYELNQVGASGE